MGPEYKKFRFWVYVVASLAGLVLASGAVTDPTALQVIGGLAGLGAGVAGGAVSKELKAAK